VSRDVFGSCFKVIALALPSFSKLARRSSCFLPTWVSDEEVVEKVSNKRMIRSGVAGEDTGLRTENI